MTSIDWSPRRNLVRLASFRTRAAHEREPGQILILFALLLTSLLGLLGLAMDGGLYLQAKRGVQASADVAALAGARQITKGVAAGPDVLKFVTENKVGAFTPTLFDCEYINDGDGVYSGCDAAPTESGVSGVRVKTRVLVPTVFMRLFNFNDDMVAKGYAKARVQVSTSVGADSPFIICGTGAWDVSADPTTKNTGTGSLVNLLTSYDFDDASKTKIDPSMAGKTFRVHDNQLDKKGVGAGCNTQGNRFKGLADQPANRNKTVPTWFTYDTGTKAGPTESKVSGIEGCAAGIGGDAAQFNCIMLIPIAVNNPAESGNSKEVRVVGYAAFHVVTVDGNSHNATLINNFIVSGPGLNGWTPSSGGVATIRLNW